MKEKVEDEETKKRKVVYRLYYTTDNSLEYHGEETSFLIIPKHFIKCIQYLFQCYPNFASISELPCEDSSDKVRLELSLLLLLYFYLGSLVLDTQHPDLVLRDEIVAGNKNFLVPILLPTVF